MILIMEDREVTLNEGGIVHSSDFGKIDGFAHCLVCAAHKSKRVSYSTSHAETLSACFGKELAQVLSFRITEVLGSRLLHMMVMRDRVPTVNELIKMHKQMGRQVKELKKQGGMMARMAERSMRKGKKKRLNEAKKQGKNMAGWFSDSRKGKPAGKGRKKR